VPTAQIEVDGAARRIQSVAHLRVLWPSDIRRVGRVTAVFLQEIHADRGEGAGVKLFVTERARPSPAGLCTAVCVDAEFESCRVNCISECLDAAGELRRVGNEHAVLVATGKDTVI
jgi:hypothetical protein